MTKQDLEHGTERAVFSKEDEIDYEWIKMTWHERVAILTREIARNAKEQGATKMDLMVVQYKGDSYALIATNAKPFASLEKLKKCLEPGKSGGEAGVLGSGMKMAMFLCERDKHCKLIIHSRNVDDNAFSAQLSCSFVNTGWCPWACIEENASFGNYIEKFFGKYYTDFNCFFAYKLEVNSRFGFSIDSVAIMRDYVDISGLEVNYFPYTKSIGKDFKHKSYEAVVDACGSTTKKTRVFSLDEIKEHYLIEKGVFEVKDIEFSPKDYPGLKCNAVVELEIYPGLRVGDSKVATSRKSKSHPSLMSLRGKSFGQGHRANELSKSSLLVYYDEETIKQQDNYAKNLDRMYEDPFYASRNNSNYLSMLGIYVRDDFDQINKLETYELLNSKEFTPQVVKKICSWQPRIKMNIRICGHESLKGESFASFIRCFGSLNKFFYVKHAGRNALDKIISNIVAELATENPQELKDFRNVVKKHIPQSLEVKGFIPLPDLSDIEEKNHVCNVYTTKAMSSETKVRTIEPGDSLREVYLYDQDRKPIDVDVKVETAGFYFRRIHSNCFQIDVDKMSKMVGKDKVPVTIEEYKPILGYLPKKTCHVYINNIRYRIGITCILPVKKTAPRRAKKASGVEKSEVTGTRHKYIEGKSCEYVRYNDQYGLQINYLHPALRDVVRISEPGDKKVVEDFKNFFIELSEINKEIQRRFEEDIEMQYKNAFNDDTWNQKYENLNSYYLNTSVELLFTHGAAFQDILSRVKDIKEAAGGFEPIEEDKKAA